MDQAKLNEARDFYNDRIKGWMIADLKKSLASDVNFLTALGCFVYTEVIGIFLPTMSNESGKPEKKRFYRCLYRMKSSEYLHQLDRELVRLTNKGIYAQCRHNMIHKYFPNIIKRQKDVVSFLPSIVAKHGVGLTREASPPIFIDTESRIAIAFKNYIDELEEAVDFFYKKTFIDKDPDYQRAAIRGVEVMLRGQL